LGIDIDGKMIIGAKCRDTKYEGDYDFIGWANERGLEVLSPWFDADILDCYVGFVVRDIQVSGIDERWMDSLIDKSMEFEKLLGCEASLLGLQNVT